MTPRDRETPDASDAETEGQRRQRLDDARARADQVRQRIAGDPLPSPDDLLPDLDAPLPARRETPASEGGFYTAPDVPPDPPPPSIDPAILPRVRIAAAIVAVLATVAAGIAIFSMEGLIPSILLAVAIASGMVWLAAAPVDADPPTGLRGMLLARIEDLWDNEAASFYGIGTLATFIQLEVRAVLNDFAQAGGILEFIQGEIGEYVIGFSMRSLMNTIQAAMWPVNLFTTWSVLGMAGLGLGFALWDRIHDWVDDMIRIRNMERKRLHGTDMAEGEPENEDES